MVKKDGCGGYELLDYNKLPCYNQLLLPTNYHLELARPQKRWDWLELEFR